MFGCKYEGDSLDFPEASLLPVCQKYLKLNQKPFLPDKIYFIRYAEFQLHNTGFSTILQPLRGKKYGQLIGVKSTLSL
jgi:hypothetical protein